MTPERWQQISRIFRSAISLDNEERSAYLEGVDDSLREEVEKLIQSHQKASEDKFIDGVAAEQNAALLVGEDELSEQHPRLSKGQHLGSYVILDAIGVGGMGEVYLAKDSRLGRTVALKVLSEDIASDKRRMQRFRQEAKIASSLNQPNILTIFEFGEIEGLTFLATEFIDGETLRNSLRAKKLEIAEVVDIAIQVLAALDAAHEARIVHRDIKPENVMIRRRDGVVKVLDFGLAKVAERKQSSIMTDQYSDLEAATEFKTAPHTVMGTVNYMSPEQAQARTVDERTDIWSTGVMIYEMVSGVLPFKGATVSHTVVQILEKDPVPLTQFRKRKVPADLQRMVAKALAKNPAERYQTAKDMMIDLRTLKKYLESEIVNEHSASQTRVMHAPTDPVGPRPTRHASYNKKRNSLIATAIAVTALIGIFGIKLWHTASEQTNSSKVVSLPPVLAVNEERTLAYWITVQKFRNKKAYQDPFPLPGEMIFEADYQIRMNFRSPQPGHLYVLSEGPESASAETQFVTLFPSSSANKGSSLLPADQEIQIPETTWFQFDKEQGTEMLWLVFSEDAIPELEALREFAATRTRGLITDPARNLEVQNFLTTNSTQKPTTEKGSTQTTVKVPGKLLVYPVKLEHH